MREVLSINFLSQETMILKQSFFAFPPILQCDVDSAHPFHSRCIDQFQLFQVNEKAVFLEISMAPTTPGPRIHVVSARTSQNPYALINLYCAKVRTKEHSQFVGILSFALFICLTVASFMVYEAEAIFFIVFGIFIYAFLTESLFRSPRPCGVLMYLVFEVGPRGFRGKSDIYFKTFRPSNWGII